MRTAEEIRARKRARYASDPVYRARRIKASKKGYEANRETILYERRVSYHQGEKEKRLEATNRCIADPERKARYREKRARRAWKAKLRARSRAEFLKGVSIQEMQRPTYRLIDATGKRKLETWPLDDEAARWLAEHEAAACDRQTPKAPEWQVVT